MTNYNVFYSPKSLSRFWIKKISVLSHISWTVTPLYSRRKLLQSLSRDNWSDFHPFKQFNTPPLSMLCLFSFSLFCPFLQVPGKLLLWSHCIPICIYICFFFRFQSTSLNTCRHLSHFLFSCVHIPILTFIHYLLLSLSSFFRIAIQTFVDSALFNDF